LALSCGSGSSPSDADLIAQFLEHRRDFDRVLEMLRADSPTWRVDPTWIDPQGSLSEARWEEYRHLFEKLSLERGVAREPASGNVQFISSSWGIAIGPGGSKGIFYSEHSLARLYPSLDLTPEELPETEFAYRRIDENWYLFVMAHN